MAALYSRSRDSRTNDSTAEARFNYQFRGLETRAEKEVSLDSVIPLSLNTMNTQCGIGAPSLARLLN